MLYISCHIFSLRATFFFFNGTAPTEIYTLSLHDALPIFARGRMIANPAHHVPHGDVVRMGGVLRHESDMGRDAGRSDRSEEHTSELQSRRDLVCRLLLEKKKKNTSEH